MICAFLGEHKNPFKRLGELEWFITSLAMNPKIHEFYVGNHTDFEKVILCVLRSLKERYGTIQYSLVLTPAEVNCAEEKESVVWLEPDMPEGMEIGEYSQKVKERIITLRNEWLAENTDMIIYSDYLENGKEDWIEAYAREHKKEAMNIAYDEYFV